MSDLMREEFESAMAEMLTRDTADTVTALDLMNCRDGNEYKSHVLSSAWWAWQASRECLVIDLPPEPEYPDEPDDAIDDSYMDEYHSSVGMRHACINFIHAAGVKTI